MLHTDQSHIKKSRLSKFIDSFHRLKLCNHQHQHHHQATPPAPPTNTSIAFPLPEPFKHPPQPVLVHSTATKLNLKLSPSSTNLCTAVVCPKTSQKPSLFNEPSRLKPSQKPSFQSRPSIQSAYTTPTKASTAPCSPISTPATGTRCCGTTREGKPCSRKPMKALKPSPDQYSVDLNQKLDELDQVLLTSSPPSPGSQDLPVPRFCFQHYQKVNSQSGAFFGKSIWIEYSDWFASELPEDVKITLKTEMSKQPTEKDRSEYGYLYCHEMRPTRGGEQAERAGTYIKVGRSTRPVARYGEWSKQCPSRTPVIRGFFPEISSGVSSNNNHTQQACYLDGIQTVSSRGIRFHRKWERLTLVELAGWAVLQRQGNHKSPCIDCSKVHLELFELDLGSFERLVKPLILKWQKWCQFAYL